ncbi:MAG: F0F1 ATP synthase subunit alpha, partial [Candidatus Dadabacteria bacterium]|nr:F0F1 ATP synthase subunit alpha [Candidatus Dadabacteria bacterium]
KQGQYEPLPVEKQILIIYAVSNGYVDDYPIDKVSTYEKELYSFFDAKYPELLKDIKTKKEIGDDLRESILKALDELKAQIGEL